MKDPYTQLDEALNELATLRARVAELERAEAELNLLRTSIMAAASETDHAEHKTHWFTPMCAKCRLDELRGLSTRYMA